MRVRISGGSVGSTAACARPIPKKTGRGQRERLKGKTAVRGRRRLDRAGLGQRQGDRRDLRARGGAGVLRRSQRRRRRGDGGIIAAEGGKAAAFTADASRAADVEAMVAACRRPMAASTCSTTMSASPRWERGRRDGSGMGPRVRGQSQERLSRHEARHPGDGGAGRRLDHQHLVDRLDPPSRHFLCHLCHDQGRDEPDDAHHGGRIRARNIGSTRSCRA